MRQYRKKPVVIEAFQWTGQEDTGYNVIVTEQGTQLVIPTLEGAMYASIGDWIITGVAGEVYPCKPHIFTATYERV